MLQLSRRTFLGAAAAASLSAEWAQAQPTKPIKIIVPYPAGGASDILQLFTRPIASLNPYKTAIDGVYLCSSSTPPGIGVHGMCGYYAAQSAMTGALRD